MKLQGRNLSLRMKGEDVKLLHGELRKLDYRIPTAETSRQFFGASTRQAVMDFQKKHRLETTGVVDERTAKRINAAVGELPQQEPEEPRPEPKGFVVRGQVRQTDGSLLIGGTVRAFDKDLRSDEMLGEAVTDQDGRYEIKYTAAQFLRAEKKSADLIVRVLSREGPPLAASPIIFNAQAEETVDLIIGGEAYRGPSEYEQYLAELTPVLQGVELADLTEKDVAFLSGETGINPEHIAFLVVGARLGQKTDLRAEAFYGLFRQNLPTDLPALLAQSPEVQRRALETALRDNIIPARLRDETEAILERLRQLIVDHAFQPPNEQGRTSLGDLLNTVLPIRGKQKAFLDRYVRHEGPIEDFWKDLRENPEFRGDVDNLQFTLQLGILTQNHLPLVRELRTRPEKTLKSLAKMEVADWRELIRKQVDGKPIGFPPDVPGKDDEEKASNYAKIMTRMIEDAFPTAVIASRVEKDNLPRKSDLLTFFANNPNFDFGTTFTDSYLTQNAGALDGVADKAGLTNQLKGMQRVFKLTPRYSQMRVLLADNLSSAHAITRMAQNVFMQKYGEPLGGAVPAKTIYENAAQVSATALHLLAQHGMASSKVSLQSVPDKSLEQVEGIPDWETLFGSLDLCECEHCRSVYSPAAYLVDALHFLNDRHLVDTITRDGQGNIIVTYKKKTLPDGNEVNKSAKDALFERRPDLGEIELTCENTNTPLPYVDLVNEVLENAVSPGTAVSDQNRQTHGTPQELTANPQYLNPGAYDTLGQQVYPWSLSFDLWSEEARAYLGHLGVSRHQIMETFLAGDRPTLLNNATIAREYLGITPAEAKLITGVTTSQPGAASPGIWNLWGFNMAQLDAQNSIPDPADSTARITSGDWLDRLAGRVDVLLQQSGLKYTEMLDLLDTHCINPLANGARKIQIVSTDLNNQETCETAKLKLAGLDQATALKIPRFFRLWRKLGWTMRDLDKAITALNPSDLNDTFLTQVSHVKRLQAGQNLPVVSLLSWWAPLDTRAYIDHSANGEPLLPSLYAQLFRNKAVTNPLDEDFAEDGENLSGKLSEQVATIMAALGISADDFSLLFNDANVIPRDAADPTKPDDKLSLDYLSRLYRHATLAKALKLPIRDYLSALKLISANPFVAVADTVLFVERIGKIRVSGFSMAELDYLLRHQFVASSRIAPTEQSIALVLDEIRVGLQKIAADNTFAPDPTGELTQKKLAILLKSDDVAKAMALLDGTSTDTQAAKEAFIDHHFSTQTEFAKFLSDTTDAKAKLVGATPFAEKQERFEYVLKPLLGYLAQASSRSLVKQKLSEALKVDAAATEQLLTQWVNSPTHPVQKSMSEFLAPVFAESNPNVKLTAAAFPDQFKGFALLHKIAMLISKFRLTPEQVAWLFDYGPAVGWLDLNVLPLDVTNSGSGLFTGWERLIDLFQLREALPLGESVLSDIFSMAREAAATEATLLKNLSEGTGWSLENLQFLAGAQGFGFTFPEAYKDERAPAQLKAGFAMMQRLGVSAAQCRAWTKPDLTNDDARNIKQAVKAKYDGEPWLKIARPLRDILREKQRAALVSYLVAHPDSTKGQTWNDANGLYEYFLIDVEMNPCMMTSRIKQALSSVQLFVQRCLMSLEPEAAANAEVDTKWREWKWMKNYRVWEANRKVFLYPENWIEPELRDDKSPFFKDFENELMQNDVTIDTAEAAFLNYLEKLDAVAQLEICGMNHQVETDQQGNTAVDILHVFGRTHNTPHVYYYRRRVDSAYWTAWEKVDLDIEGDHLIPVTWNRRPYLFWPVFTEKQEEKPVTMPTEATPLTPGDKYWEIQLAWSEYKNKKWLPKKISKEKGEVPPRVKKQDIFSDVVFENGDLNLFLKYSAIPPTSSTSDPEPALVRIKTPPSQEEPTLTIHELRFRFVGCEDKVDIQSDFAEGSLLLLPGTRQEFMSFVHEQPTKRPLFVLKRPTQSPLTLAELDPTGRNLNYSPTLDATPGNFRVCPEQFQRFDAHSPIFYSDDARTFFVIPGDVLAPKRDWPFIDRVRPEMLDLRDYYYAQRSPIRDPIGPDANPVERLIYEPSFPMEDGVNTARAIGIPAAHGGSMTIDTSAGAESGVSPGSRPQSVRIRSGAAMSAFMTSNVVDILHNGALDKSVYLPIHRWARQYRFETFYHPYLCLFIRELNRDGIDGLLQRSIQMEPHIFLNPPQAFDFSATYKPKPVVIPPLPQEDVDFSHGGAYAPYNWELFFHAPLIIANRLSKNQRFEEAQKWFHYIFDPTDTSGLDVPQKYWRTRPFYETAKPDYLKQQIENLLKRLASDEPDLELEQQVNEWRAHPFNPHLIARLRTTAYQKTVVMKYIDNLIAWGDQLFRRDTIETLNEATQLYILAAEILGRRPENIPPRATPQVQSYNALEPKLDDFSNALVNIENLVPTPKQDGAVSPAAQPPLTLPAMLYFCVPKNDTLLGYWDKVADRLFKIRHCMNIEGVERQLPLFEPPIDPGLLVRAAALGVDLTSALNDINAALPHYRFNVMAQKASELCADLKALGGALLSALEKRDAEALALLRSTHEINVLNAVRQVREKQIEEAKQALEGTKKSRDMVNIRHTYYANIQFMNPAEIAHLALVGTSLRFQLAQANMHLVEAVLHLLPNLKLGAPTSIGTTYGGHNVGNSSAAFSDRMGAMASISNTAGSLSATLGGYQRRSDDWKLQERLAAKELEQMEKQIIAAEIRLAIAERELQNHDLQVENALGIDAYMHDKFTNRELYDWMVSQISSIYFQSYQLVYDVAKRTERAYRYEIGLEDSNFIQFGYWDSLKKGLLAGERLYQDLKRMEVAYLDQNKREYEITKHISLTQLDPLALIQLKQTGECFVNLPEVLFDLDYPGHYMRRIKAVSMTIPCVTGPYISVNCTLTLLKSSIRKTSTLLGGEYSRQDGDPRFEDNIGAIQSIATSSAQSDSGLFEPNLHDERYLPFEGAGVISEWRMELPTEFKQFDYDTISDVVLHLRYTCREGGELLKHQATTDLQAALNEFMRSEGQTGLALLFSSRHEFSSAWHRFLNPPAGSSGDQTLTMALTKERFPFLLQNKTITINTMELFVKVRPEFANTHNESSLKLSLEVGAAASDTSLTLAPWNGLLRAGKSLSGSPGDWTLTAWLDAGGGAHERLDPNAIQDILIVCCYAWS